MTSSWLPVQAWIAQVRLLSGDRGSCRQRSVAGL